MINSHPAARQLKSLGALSTVAAQAALLDSATVAAKAAKDKALLDDVSDEADAARAAAEATFADISLLAAATVQEWAKTDAADIDTEAGESLATRLISLLIAVADANQDGELTEDEATVVNIAMNAAFDYLVSKGISEDDASALLNDEDGDAAQRIAEFLKSVVPAAEADAQADVDDFVFDPESETPILDSARTRDILDGVFKRRLVAKGANKVHKQVTGHVTLSSKHKVSARRAHMAAHSASSRVKRLAGHK